jgi:hypothetical protein
VGSSLIKDFKVFLLLEFNTARPPRHTYLVLPPFRAHSHNKVVNLAHTSHSAMADRFRPFCKDEVLTYAYILLYIALSSAQIFFNKVALFH